MVTLRFYMWSGLNIMWRGVCTATTEMYFPWVTATCGMYSLLLLLIQNIYFLLSGDRGCTVMYAFTLLTSECVYLMIGTLDIFPVHRACLTLHEIWFLEKCNHGLQCCFLLSRSEKDKLELGRGGGRCFRYQFHRRAILYTSSVSLC